MDNVVLTEDVRKTLGIPDLSKVKSWISEHPEYQGALPTDRQLEMFFLLHPEYGGLSEKDVAELYGISQQAVNQSLQRFFLAFPRASFTRLSNQNAGMSCVRMQRWNHNMDHLVVEVF